MKNFTLNPDGSRVYHSNINRFRCIGYMNPPYFELDSSAFQNTVGVRFEIHRLMKPCVSFHKRMNGFMFHISCGFCSVTLTFYPW